MKKMIATLMCVVFATTAVACGTKNNPKVANGESTVTVNKVSEMPTEKPTEKPEPTKQPTATPEPTPIVLSQEEIEQKSTELVRKILKDMPGWDLADDQTEYDIYNSKIRFYIYSSEDITVCYPLEVKYSEEKILGAVLEYSILYDAEGKCFWQNESEPIRENQKLVYTVVEPGLSVPVDFVTFSVEDTDVGELVGADAVSFEEALKGEPFEKEVAVFSNDNYTLFYGQKYMVADDLKTLTSTVRIQTAEGFDVTKELGNQHSLESLGSGVTRETVSMAGTDLKQPYLYCVYRDSEQNILFTTSNQISFDEHLYEEGMMEIVGADEKAILSLHYSETAIPACQAIGLLELKDAQGQSVVKYDYDSLKVISTKGTIDCKAVFNELNKNATHYPDRTYNWNWKLSSGQNLECQFREYIRDGAYSASSEVPYYEWGLEASFKLDGVEFYHENELLTPC